MHKSSGMLLRPDRRISSCVITKMAAGEVTSFCSFLDTDVTSMFIRSSRLASVRSRRGFCAKVADVKIARTTSFRIPAPGVPRRLVQKYMFYVSAEPPEFFSLLRSAGELNRRAVPVPADLKLLDQLPMSQPENGGLFATAASARPGRCGGGAMRSGCCFFRAANRYPPDLPHWHTRRLIFAEYHARWTPGWSRRGRSFRGRPARGNPPGVGGFAGGPGSGPGFATRGTVAAPDGFTGAHAEPVYQRPLDHQRTVPDHQGFSANRLERRSGSIWSGSP